jgi:hypothetical protein
MKNLTKLISLTLGAALLATTALSQEKKPEKAILYPLEICIVTDEKLGEMGKPHVFVHEGQEIKLCCKSCLKRFNKEPQRYLKKLADAAKSPKKGKAR